MQGWVVSYSRLFHSFAYRERHPRLFREAAQLKTVDTADQVVGLSCIHDEAQIDTGRPVGRSRPDGTFAADADQRA